MPSYGWIFGAGTCGDHDARFALRRASGEVVSHVVCAPPAPRCSCPIARVVFRYDATPVLRQFAREVALDVAYLWNPSPIVLRYLKTGDESIRRTACDDAWVATWAGAKDAAWYAAGAATRAADSADAVVVARDAANVAAAATGAAVTTRGVGWGAAAAATERRQSRRLARLLMAGRRLYGQRSMP